jgi:hypothetical protein
MSHPRDLTQIRQEAAVATSALRTLLKSINAIATIAGQDDARELKRRPTLRSRYSPKKAKKGARRR